MEICLVLFDWFVIQVEMKKKKKKILFRKYVNIEKKQFIKNLFWYFKEKSGNMDFMINKINPKSH